MRKLKQEEKTGQAGKRARAARQIMVKLRPSTCFSAWSSFPYFFLPSYIMLVNKILFPGGKFVKREHGLQAFGQGGIAQGYAVVLDGNFQGAGLANNQAEAFGASDGGVE